MTNAASTRGIARQRKQAAEDTEGARLTLVNIMQHPQGRRWFWLLLSEAQVFSDTENLDHGALAYRAGKRSLGLLLMSSLLRHVPDNYIRMTNENSSANLEEPSDGGSTDDPTE